MPRAIGRRTALWTQPQVRAAGAALSGVVRAVLETHSLSSRCVASEADRPPTFRFKLLRDDGTDLGLLTTSEPDWTAGQQIHQADGTILEVVRTVAAEPDDNVHGYLIVRSRQAATARRGRLEADDPVPVDRDHRPPGSRQSGRAIAEDDRDRWRSSLARTGRSSHGSNPQPRGHVMWSRFCSKRDSRRSRRPLGRARLPLGKREPLSFSGTSPCCGAL